MILFSNQKGFTLIELIVSLIVSGVVLVLAGMAMAPFLKGYFDARERMEISQKAQIAMERMIKEFTMITSVSSGNQQSISFSSQHGTSTESHTISWAGSGTPLMLDSDILTDGVDSFSLTYIYYSGSSEIQQTSWTASSEGIQIDLVMQGATNITQSARVYPRNLQ